MHISIDRHHTERYLVIYISHQGQCPRHLPYNRNSSSNQLDNSCRKVDNVSKLVALNRIIYSTYNHRQLSLTCVLEVFDIVVGGDALTSSVLLSALRLADNSTVDIECILKESKSGVGYWRVPM